MTRHFLQFSLPVLEAVLFFGTENTGTEFVGGMKQNNTAEFSKETVKVICVVPGNRKEHSLASTGVI